MKRTGEISSAQPRRAKIATDSAVLIAIVVIFILLAVVYATVTPIFEASDERWHYPVVRYIIAEHTLPIQDPSVPTLWHQEGSQPPLYYLLAAGLTSTINTQDFEAVHRPNPHAIVGLPLETGNKNMMLHSQHKDWPWQGAALAVAMIRLMSIGLGAITIYLTWLIARRLWPADSWIPLLAAALVAFNPMFIFISASVNNDNLAATLGAAIMLALLNAVRRPHGQTVGDGIWLGVLLGLGALTKIGVLTLVPLAAAGLTWDAARHKKWRSWLLNGLLIVGLVLIIAGWWYWRNWALYGDPTGISRMLDIAGRRHEPLTLSRLWAEFEGFRISYWGLFGAVNILADRWIYTVLDILTAAGTLGLLVSCVNLLVAGRQPGKPAKSASPQPLVLVLLIVWVGLVLISLIRWTSQTYASQGRLMFVAIAGIASLLAVGLATLTPPAWRKLMATAVGTGLLLLALACPVSYIGPAYAQAPILDETDLPTDLEPVNWDINSQMRLLGYRLDQSTVRPLEKLPITIYWQALAPMSEDYSVFVHLLGRDRTVVGQINSYPGLGTRPTTNLQPGDILADSYLVPVALDAEAPTRLRVHAGLYRYQQEGRPALEAQNADGNPVEPWLTSAKLVPWDWDEPQPSQALDVQFGEFANLLGYDLDPAGLTLYWQTTGSPGADLNVFIQAWDDQEQLAGFDGPPLQGDYPTSWWEPGELIVDQHPLDLSQLPAKANRLRVGLYQLDSGQRIPAADDQGPLPDFALDIALEDKR